MKIKVFDEVKLMGNGLKTTIIDYAPVILTAVGCISLIGGTVAACIRTSNLDDLKKRRDDILDVFDKDHEDEKLDDRAYNRAVRNAYISWGWDIVKNYAPTIALDIFGVACIIKGQTMWVARCASLGALLTEQIQKNDFLEQRIRDIYGEEALKELKSGNAVVYTNKDGERETVVEAADRNILDEDLSFIWHEGMGDFCPDDNGMNYRIAKSIENTINQACRKYGGYAAINMFYEMFGAYNMTRTEYDKVMLGWPNAGLMDHTCRIVIEELPFKMHGSVGRAPDLKISFAYKHQPIVCSKMMIDAGYRAA